MNLVDLLDAQAAERADAAAIITSRLGFDTRLSFAELAEASRGYAACLQEEGIGEGDAVIVFVPMSPQLYVLLSALWRLGAVALFVDPSASRESMRRCTEMVPPKAFVGSRRAQVLRALSPALRDIPTAFVTGCRFPGAVTLNDERPFSTPSLDLGPEAPALITFTSGSTGRPKAILRTHGFLVAQFEVLLEQLDLRPGQVDLATLPIFALANLAAGVTTVIPDADLRRPGSILAGPVLRQNERLGVDRCTASPAFFERILAYCETNDVLLGVERVDTGGGPVFPALLERLAARAPRAEIHAVYGSSEAEPIADLRLGMVAESDRQAMRDGKGLLAGRPVAHIDVRILKTPPDVGVHSLTAKQFEEMCAPVDVAGGIAVSGPHVVKGYLGGEGDSDTKFDVEGVRWHRTGDAGYLDADGRLWLLGREVARVATEKGDLWPFAVEASISGFRDVARAALVQYGSRRVLAVQPTLGSQLDVTALRERLSWAQLDDIVSVRAIPVDRRHNAKVDYPALRELMERELD